MIPTKVDCSWGEVLGVAAVVLYHELRGAAATRRDVRRLRHDATVTAVLTRSLDGNRSAAEGGSPKGDVPPPP